MRYYLSLGSNLGEREQTLSQAAEMLNQSAGRVVARSAFYYSAPWGFQSDNGFCNQCLCIESELQPMEMLHATQSIERALGRTHKTKTDAQHLPTEGYSDRLIDIDILEAQDGEEAISVQTKELTIPHPLMKERDFVMIPLQEVMGKKQDVRQKEQEAALETKK